MRRNAERMRQTSVSTARAKQHAVIDMDTLRHVHAQLIATVEEVREIHRDGMQQQLARRGGRSSRWFPAACAPM